MLDSLTRVKIVCLVKQVPRGDAIEFDQETKSLKREGVPLELNAFDAYAVAWAVRLREAHGDGEVIAMTMGPPQAEEALRATLAIGADRCIHLSDRLFAVADTIGTSRTLALAVEKEGADLVLCGRKTLDSETWQVPPEVAARLGWPQFTSAVGLEPAGDRLRVRVESAETEDLYETGLPALCSVARPPAGWSDNGLPSPEAGDRITIWTASDLVSDPHPNDKRFGQTGSPTRVLAVRDVTPERAGERFDDPEAAAERVRSLLAERPPSQSSWEKPERLGEKPGHAYDCWSVVELVEGRPARVSLELLAKGRELAGKLGGRNVALVLGHGVEQAGGEAIRHGAEEVVLVDDAGLAEYDPARWASALRQVLDQERPHALLIPATPQGRDYGPRAAGDLELGMTGDCVDLGIDRAGRLIQHKPAYGGNIVSVIMGATTPQLATVRPRMFEPLDPRDDGEAAVRRFSLEPWPEVDAQRLERGEPQRAFDLDESEAVVAIGAGVGDAGAVEELNRLAAGLGAAIGGDREACAAGLVPPARQLGLLGRAVAPRLYVAVDTVGDFEDLTGSVKADVIVALSDRAGSPLLDAADVALAGPWRETLPGLVNGLSAG
jgi:electron transfer flavoprotein alpha/beta subunit